MDHSSFTVIFSFPIRRVFLAYVGWCYASLVSHSCSRALTEILYSVNPLLFHLSLLICSLLRMWHDVEEK